MKFMALVASGFLLLFLFLFLFLVGLLVVTAVWKRRSRDGLTTTFHAACNCATNADGLAVFGTWKEVSKPHGTANHRPFSFGGPHQHYPPFPGANILDHHGVVLPASGQGCSGRDVLKDPIYPKGSLV